MTIFFEGDTKVLIGKNIHVMCNTIFYVVDGVYYQNKYTRHYGSSARVLFQYLKRK
jgi:hypothetical protein